MDEPIGFIMTAETAMRFFELCLEREAVTKEERIALLRELMTQEIKTQEAFTNIVKDKKVLIIKGKDRKRNTI